MAKRYDLGTVVGKIVFNYDDKGTTKSKKELDDMKDKAEKFGKSFNEHSATVNKNAASIALSFGRVALAMSALAGGINIIGAIGSALAAMSGIALLIPAALLAGAAAMATFKLGADGIKKAFEGLKPTIDDLKKNVSAAFEKSLTPAVNNLKSILPQLKAGLAGIATAAGEAATKFTAMLKTPQNIAVLNTVLDGTKKIIQNLGAALAPLGQAFLDIASVGTQVFTNMTAGAGAAAERFAAWIREAKESGKLAAIIQGAIDAFKAFGAILADVGSILHSFFTAFQAAGLGVAGTLGVIISKLAEFLKSAQGQEILTSLATSLGRVAEVVGTILMTALQQLAPAIPPLMDAFAGLAENVLPVLLDVLNFIGPILVTVAQAIADNIGWIAPLVKWIGIWIAIQWALNAALTANPIGIIIAAIGALIALVAVIISHWSEIGAFFKKLWDNVWKWTSDRLTAIRDFFVTIWNNILSFFQGIGTAIGTAVQSVLNWFASLPGKIGTFLASLPGILWNAFTTAFMFALNAVIQGVEWIIAASIAIPLRIIEGIINFGQMLWDWAVAAWQFAVDATVAAIDWIVTFVTELPGRIIEAVAAFGQMIADWATNAWNWAQDVFWTIIDAIVEFVKQLPQRIVDGLAALGQMIVDLATTAWNWFLETIKSIASDVWEFVKSIPGRILEALGDLGNLLWNAGKAVIDGLLNGIKAAVKAVWDFVSGIADKIKSLKGPIEYDKKLLIDEGQAIMDSLGIGLDKGLKPVLDSVSTMGDQLKSAMADAVAGNYRVNANGTVTAGVDMQDANKQLLNNMAASLAPVPGTTPNSGDAYGQRTVNIGLLNVNITGNLDPTNPVAWRKAIVNIQEGIRGVERANA